MNHVFPPQNLTNAQKKSPEHGKKVAAAILSYENDGGFVQYRRERFHTNKKLAEGLQNPDFYKPFLGDFKEKGGSEYYNLFWQVVNPMSKYISNAVALLTSNNYEPVASAYDPLSKTEREGEKAKLIGNMVLKMGEQFIMGNDYDFELAPKGEFAPASADEIMIHTKMNMKTSLEMATEIGAKIVFGNNDFQYLKQETGRELVINKWAAREVYYDPYGDIKIYNVPAEDIIVPNTKDPYFKKRKFTGVLKYMTVDEIRQYNYVHGGYMSEEELFKLANNNAAKHNNPAWSHDYHESDQTQKWNSFTLEVLSFEYHDCLLKEWVTYKRKKGGTMIKKKDDKNYDNPKYNQISKKRNVYFDGMYVVGSDQMLQWEVRKNMAMNGDGLNDSEPESRYIVVAPGLYQMQNRSIPQAAEKHLHQLQMIALKKQHLIQNITPAKISINANALDEDIIEGLGLEGEKVELIKLYKAYGILFHSGTAAGSMKPIEEIPTYAYQELAGLVNAYNAEMREMEGEIGLNDILVGSDDNQYETIGSKQMKLNSSVRALNDLEQALNYMNDKTLQITDRMVKDSIARGDYKMIKGYEKALGKANVDVIKISKRETLVESGIKLELLPNQKDIEKLEIRIEKALDQRTITWEDAEEARRIAQKSIKMAIAYMNIARVKFERSQQQMAAATSQQNGQIQQQSIAAKAQADERIMMVENKLNGILEQLKGEVQKDIDNNKARNEAYLQGAQADDKLDQIREGKKQGLEGSSTGNPQVRAPRA